jgi:hypothetical protein
MRTTSNDVVLHFGERYVLRHSRPGDAFTILKDLRQEDRDEWDISVEGGVDVHLLGSIMGSAECYTVADTKDDSAHVIFGVFPLPEPTTWMLGTNQGQVDCGWMLGMAREFYGDFFTRWPNTVCYSAPENAVHHRWLEWMRYRLIKATPWGPFGKLFYEYRKEA